VLDPEASQLDAQTVCSKEIIAYQINMHNGIHYLPAHLDWIGRYSRYSWGCYSLINCWGYDTCRWRRKTTCLAVSFATGGMLRP
jgi:hypothetical protein